MKVVHVRRDQYDVYIGRACYEFSDSKWANPFKIDFYNDREAVLQKYEEYLRNNEELMSQIMELDGKILGCWCFPKKCHGDIIIKIINEIKHQNKFKIEY